MTERYPDQKLSPLIKCVLEEVCACPKHISPVCGEDGNDYHNPCLAKCKTKVKCKGKCPCA